MYPRLEYGVQSVSAEIGGFHRRFPVSNMGLRSESTIDLEVMSLIFLRFHYDSRRVTLLDDLKFNILYTMFASIAEPGIISACALVKPYLSGCRDSKHSTQFSGCSMYCLFWLGTHGLILTI